jgi:hypothetical protein
MGTHLALKGWARPAAGKRTPYPLPRVLSPLPGGHSPLGGRVGLAFGEPLRRWGRGVFSGQWDQVPHGPVRKGRRRRVLRRLTHHQPCGWSPATA